MAYFVLSYLQVPAGGRKAAARVLMIDDTILGKIGELSSTGDLSTARKVPKNVPLRPLSGPETSWLEEAVKLLILRCGELASGATPSLATMAQLPRM
jgi:hypothetical protein